MSALLELAELAAHAGLSTARLRHFDDAGLLAPARRDRDRHGYHPDEAAVVRLLDQADQLGIPTADLTALAAAWRSGDCPTATSTLAEAVARRTSAAQDDVADQTRQAAQAGPGTKEWAQITSDSLPAFERAARLQTAAQVLADADHAGSCGPDCACTTALTAPVNAYRFPQPAGGDADALSCDLAADGGDARQRIGVWQQVLAQVQSREPLPDTATGLALRFPFDVELAATLARLSAAEYRCCSFGSYTLVVDGTGLTLQVRMPDGAADQLAATLGTPDTPKAAP